jgi:hypothetical protein
VPLVVIAHQHLRRGQADQLGISHIAGPARARAGPRGQGASLTACTASELDAAAVTCSLAG